MTSPIYTPHERMFFAGKLADDPRTDWPRVLTPFAPSPETQGRWFFNQTGIHSVDPEEYPEPPDDHPSYHDAPWYYDYGDLFCDAMCWSGPRKQAFVVVRFITGENPITWRNDLLVCDENFSDYAVVKQDITAHLPQSNDRSYRVHHLCAAPVVEDSRTLGFFARNISASGNFRVDYTFWTDWNGNAFSNRNASNRTIGGSSLTGLYSCMGDHSICDESAVGTPGRTGMFTVHVSTQGFQGQFSQRNYRIAHLGTNAQVSDSGAIQVILNASAVPGSIFGSESDVTRGPIYFHPSFDFITGGLLVPMLDYVGTNQWQSWVRRFDRIASTGPWTDSNLSYIDLCVTDVPAVLMDPDTSFYLPMYRPHIAWTSSPDERLYVQYLQYAAVTLTTEEKEENIGIFAHSLDGLQRWRVSDRVLSEGFTVKPNEPAMALGPGTRGRWEL